MSETAPQPQPESQPAPARPGEEAYPQQANAQPGYPQPYPQHGGQMMSAVDQRVALAEAAALAQAKSTGIAYLLWFFLGVLGAHKFYLGRIGMGFAYFFTLGFLTIGLWIDLFTLPRQTRQANLLRRAQVRSTMGV